MKRLTLLIPLALVAGAVLIYSTSLPGDGAGSRSPRLPVSAGEWPGQGLPSDFAAPGPDFLPSDRARNIGPVAEQGLVAQMTPDEIVCIEVHYGNGSSARVPPGCTPVPETPTPTAAPLPTASATPPPTNTPRATVTPVPAATDTPAATPTREDTPPPPTFTLTPVQTKTCSFQAAYGINLRSGPGTGYSDVGDWARGDVRIFDRFAVGGIYLWGHSTQGWAVVYDVGAKAWWVYGTIDSQFCDEKDGWPVGLVPPPAFAQAPPNLFGTHHIVGAREAPVIEMAPLYGTIKTTTSSETVAILLRGIRPDVTWIHRSLYVDGWMRDGPTPEEWADPNLYAQRVEQQWHGGATYYEIMNEVIPPDWPTFIRLTQTVLNYAGQRGTCLLWGSFGPGNPPIDVWPQLIPLMKWVNENPCGRNPDGSPRYHGIAWHSAMYVPEAFARGAYVTPPLKLWIVERHLLVNATLKDYGFEFALYRGPIYVTELGIDNGYAGAPEQYSCEEYAQSVALTIQEYTRLAPYITGFHLWNFGGSGIGWVNREECADEILRWVK